MKITKAKLKKMIKEVLQEDEMFDCNSLPDMPAPYGPYKDMTEEQLLKIMCRPSHYKNYYNALRELEKRGYNGPTPELRSSR